MGDARANTQDEKSVGDLKNQNLPLLIETSPLQPFNEAIYVERLPKRYSYHMHVCKDDYPANVKFSLTRLSG